MTRKKPYRHTALYRLSIALEGAKAATHDLHTSIAKLRLLNADLADAYEREAVAGLAEKVRRATMEAV